MRASQSRPRPEAEDARGGVFVLRADLISVEVRSLLQSAARAVLLSRRGSLSEQVQRARRSRARAARAPARRDARADASTPPERRTAAARARVLQRPRRLRRRRAGVRDDPRRGAVDAGALDQRHRQPVVRLPGLGRGRRLHLVGQQPREPAHAMVERSGQRPARRSDLRARRGQRRALGADRAADSRRGLAVRLLATARATAASSTPRTASRSSCCSTCRSTTRSRSRG